MLDTLKEETMNLIANSPQGIMSVVGFLKLSNNTISDSVKDTWTSILQKCRDMSAPQVDTTPAAAAAAHTDEAAAAAAEVRTTAPVVAGPEEAAATAPDNSPAEPGDLPHTAARVASGNRTPENLNELEAAAAPVVVQAKPAIAKKPYALANHYVPLKNRVVAFISNIAVAAGFGYMSKISNDNNNENPTQKAQMVAVGSLILATVSLMNIVRLAYNRLSGQDYNIAAFTAPVVPEDAQQQEVSVAEEKGSLTYFGLEPTPRKVSQTIQNILDKKVTLVEPGQGRGI
jgi:hypothetical protein